MPWTHFGGGYCLAVRCDLDEVGCSREQAGGVSRSEKGTVRSEEAQFVVGFALEAVSGVDHAVMPPALQTPVDHVGRSAVLPRLDVVNIDECVRAAREPAVTAVPETYRPALRCAPGPATTA